MSAPYSTKVIIKKEYTYPYKPQQFKHKRLLRRIINQAIVTQTSQISHSEQLQEQQQEKEDSNHHYGNQFQLLEKENGDIYGIPKKQWTKLQAPIRYMGNEFGAVHKPWNSANVRFALTYPEIYEVGSSNLGHIVLYTVLNQTDGLLCDRSYFPGSDLAQLLQDKNKTLFAVESKRPLNQFDTLGFSLSYELGGTNILEMLKLSGIPVTWEERKNSDVGGVWDVEKGSFPLIFAGGPTATSNPEPFADFFDYFALGDGEELLVEIGKCLETCKQQKLNRLDTLFQLATKVQGVYVPQFYDSPPGFGGMVVPVRKGVPERILRRVCSPDPFNQIGLVPITQTVHDRMTIEIRRGCTRGCRFCQPGMLTRPARDVDPDKVVDAVEQGLQKTGYTDFSLLSLSCSDYLSLPYVGLQIKNRLQHENVSLNLPSQRVDRFDDNIANIVSGNRKSQLTFAPEAGTQRLRDIINKGLTNEELLNGVKTAWNRGWKQVKLYFMIGLPGEVDEDVIGIAETIKWLQQECRTGKWHLAVNVTISCFTPKPHTPFQWHSVSTEEFIRKQALLKQQFAKLFQVKGHFTPPRISAMEDFIGRGDRRISKVIKRAWELGALNEAWWTSEGDAYRAWSQAIEDSNLTWKYRQVEGGEWNSLEKIGDDRYRKQGGGGKGRIDRGQLADDRLNMPLPWDHIDTGISKNWLKTDLQRALEAATVPDCSHSGICSECGVCGDEFGDNVLFEPPPTPEFLGHFKPNSQKEMRLRFCYQKTGNAVFIGNLDLMRLFQRAAKRAGLPVTSDRSPFNSQMMIQNALSLGLGVTGGRELVEIYFTQQIQPQETLQKLQKQLINGINLLGVEQIPLKRIDGVLTENMGALINQVTYQFLMESVDLEIDFQDVINQIFNMELCIIHKQTKRNNMRKINLKEYVQQIEIIQSPLKSQLSKFAPENVNKFMEKDPKCSKWVIFQYTTKFHPEFGHISPQQLQELFSEVIKYKSQLEIVHVHRTEIGVSEMKRPVLTAHHVIQLKKFVKYEGFMALKSRFEDTPWKNRLRDWDTISIY